MTKTKIDLVLTKDAKEALEVLRRDLMSSTKSRMLRNQLLKLTASNREYMDFDLITGEEIENVHGVQYKTFEVKVDEHRTIEVLMPTYKTHASPLRSSGPTPILIRALLPPEDAEDAIANLEHFYQTVWLEKHNPKTAKAIFYIQNARVILSYYVSSIRCALELYLKTKK